MMENGQSKRKRNQTLGSLHVLEGVIQIHAAIQRDNAASVLKAIIWGTVFSVKRDVYRILQVLIWFIMQRRINVSPILVLVVNLFRNRNRNAMIQRKKATQ